MLLNRLVAFPESRRILALHLMATPFTSLMWAATAILPVLLRRYFNAGEWEVTLSTAAIPFMASLTVMWNELYRRMSTGRYLAVVWTLIMAPLAAVALTHNSWTALTCIMISATGFGGMHPVNGDILRSCYPPSARTRIFAVIQATTQLSVMTGAWIIGAWLDFDEESFRTYLPACWAFMGIGVFLLWRITCLPLFQERLRPVDARPLWLSLRSVYRNMSQALRSDPTFRRYETAFCIYGLGWMICEALRPLVGTDVLHLEYKAYAQATTVTFQITLLIMLVPVSYLLDRLGVIGLTAYAFALLSLYPIGMLCAMNGTHLTWATVVYGLAMSGVNLSWTMGPISLARDASQSAYYLAIHATLVGLRALVAQFPAVILYKLMGHEWPLALGAVLFLGGSLLMLRLERDLRRRTVAEPVELETAVGPETV